jgi:hypothetical protein
MEVVAVRERHDPPAGPHRLDAQADVPVERDRLVEAGGQRVVVQASISS